MRFRFILGAVLLLSVFWFGPAQATCSALPTAPATNKCAETTEEGLCRAKPDECVWDEPAAAPAAEAAKPAASKDKGVINLQNPLSSNDIPTIVGNAIKVAMGIMGSLALVVFVYGGFRWLTAAGNSESIETGTSAMIWATIGIFIIFSSYAILQLVFNAIGAQNRGLSTPVSGGAGGTYCLVNCTAANSCEQISQAAGSDFETLDKKCTQANYSIEKKACAEVAACGKK